MAENNPVTKLISSWFRRNFSDPAAISLCLLLIFVLLLLEMFGEVLAPILISIVVAYLLHAVVLWLEKFKLPRWASFTIVYLLFLAIVVLFITMVAPVLLRQLGNLIDQSLKINNCHMW